jgi:hypothetical protein
VTLKATEYVDWLVTPSKRILQAVSILLVPPLLVKKGANELARILLHDASITPMLEFCDDEISILYFLISPIQFSSRKTSPVGVKLPVSTCPSMKAERRKMDDDG